MKVTDVSKKFFKCLNCQCPILALKNIVQCPQCYTIWKKEDE